MRNPFQGIEGLAHEERQGQQAEVFRRDFEEAVAPLRKRIDDLERRLQQTERTEKAFATRLADLERRLRGSGS